MPEQEKSRNNQPSEPKFMYVSPEAARALNDQHTELWRERLAKLEKVFTPLPAMERLRRIVNDEFRQTLEEADRLLAIEACKLIHSLAELLMTQNHLATNITPTHDSN